MKGNTMETKHMYSMTADELSKVVCMGYEGHPCSNTMDEYACRESLKDNEAFCCECCDDINGGICCG